ncbi:MAG: serine/threonine protein kinase [Planctomycetes bacterium]|nr:serine/threonine protein kinase [Planctomycetota bacterium]
MSQQHNKPTAPEATESEIGRIVIEKGLATSEEVQHCLEIQRQDSDATHRSLLDVLVAQGVVTASQLSRLEKTMEADRPRQQIPGYELLGKLGAGAMATVFKARQLSLDRTVAIKVLPKRLSENPDYVARFYKEGKAAAKLNHPNIVQAFDVGEAGGYHYFVMEYVEGHTVYDELVDGKAFAEAEALSIITQVAEALRHAHNRGFIHRDVKPKNIMLTPSGTAKLADMGLAREAKDVEAALEEKGRAFGTPYYISPEQIRGKVNVDFRADIYSLGATFYHMVTGRVPFEGETPAVVMHKHLKEQLVPPDHLNTNLSAGVGEVIEVMMAKKPEHRYSSTEDLLVDLHAIGGGEPPPQARELIGNEVLGGLTGEADMASLMDESIMEPKRVQMSTAQMTALILLGAALALSVLLNIFQAVSK